MHEEYKVSPELEDQTHLDALTFNIERACQAAIDLAMHIVASGHLGVPQSSAEAFALLQKASMLDENLADRLVRMTGFRNIAIHQYQNIDNRVIHYIMSTGWQDFVSLCKALGLNITP